MKNLINKLMNIGLYKLSFNTEIPYLNDIYGLLTDLEKERIYSFEILASFYYNSNNKYIGFLIISHNEMKEYENILNNNLIPYLCEDYSNRVIDNEINLESYLEDFLDVYNYSDYDKFIYEMNLWILKNLDLDSILDRINLNGIETLRPIDKEFLKSI